MKKQLTMSGIVTITIVMAGCAMWSDNSRPSLLAGDADIALFQTRTSKSVSKAYDSDSNTLGGGSTASPTGGGSLMLDPSQLKALLENGTLRVKADLPAAVIVSGPRDQEIVLPEPRPMSPVPTHHEVVRGDTLWDISRQYGTTVIALKRVNGLRGSLIRPGQMLRIP